MDFSLEKKIAKGHFGKVYLGKYYYFDEEIKVAVKVLNKEKLDRMQNENVDYNKEIEILENTNHRYIIKYYDTQIINNHIYMIFEYAPKDLFTRIREDFSSHDALRYLKQVTKAVQYLHKKNIMHRDIKPENVLLNEDDNCKLCDFGYSTFFVKGTYLNDFVGTVHYMAPEIVKMQPYNESIDNWMLGVLYFEMLAGEPPFYAETDKQIFKKICNLELKFNEYFPSSAKKQILSLIKINPYERASLNDILRFHF